MSRNNEDLDSERLKGLYTEDQNERKSWSKLSDEEKKQVSENDKIRRDKAITIMEGINDSEKTALDFFHAAMIFQHSSGEDKEELLNDFLRANEYAFESCRLGLEKAFWLYAATYDRWLKTQGKPQKYGTQFCLDGNDSLYLWPVDPNTTDAERAEFNVPSPDETLALLNNMH